MIRNFESKFWEQSKEVIEAISGDAPDLRTISLSNSWLVITGLNDPWMNLGYAQDLSKVAELSRITCAARLEGMVYGNSDLPKTNVDEGEYQRSSILQVHDFSVENISNWNRRTTGSVVRVKDLNELVQSNQIQIETFGMDPAVLNQVVGPKVLQNPRVAIYNLVVGKEAVSTLTAVTSIIDENPIVNIWSMATLPDQQRKGYGAHLIGQVLTDCRSVGFDSAALMASPDGKELYTPMGFRSLTENAIYQIGSSKV
jgi:GNAT superfamily N-acetyltransferase